MVKAENSDDRTEKALPFPSISIFAWNPKNMRVLCFKSSMSVQSKGTWFRYLPQWDKNHVHSSYLPQCDTLWLHLHV